MHRPKSLRDVAQHRFAAMVKTSIQPAIEYPSTAYL
jgi:hypothetical protein